MLDIIKFLLILAIGGGLGFFLAVIGSLSLLNKKGYRNFDDVPNRVTIVNPINGGSQQLADELGSYWGCVKTANEKYGCYVSTALLEVEYSDKTKKTFDLYQTAADCVCDSSKNHGAGGLVNAVYCELLARN